MDKQLLYGIIEENASLLTALSDQIWEYAELSMLEHKSTATQRAFQDLYSLGFSIAARNARAVLLPTQWLNGEPSGEDTAQSQTLTHEWGFRGMFLADDERFTAEPTRLQLEQAAMKILKFALKRI